MALPTVPRRWRFESDTADRKSSSKRALVVQAMTTLEANSSDCNLKTQVEHLLRHAYILTTGSPAKAACATADLFKICTRTGSSNSPSDFREKKDQVMERKLLLFVYASDDNEDLELHPTRISGFARVYEDAEMNVVVASSFAIHGGASEEKEHEIVRALFHATQEVGEAFVQSILLQQQTQQPSNTRRRSSMPLWRGIFGGSEYLKQYFRDRGFSGDSFDRLEMTKVLDSAMVNSVEEEVASFPEDVTVKPLDLQQDDLVKVFDVLKMAFGGNPLSFDAWKIHYAQHPRLAPELSFVAWGANGKPVSVVLIERIVEGEGGGDNEVDRVYATQRELAKANNGKCDYSTPDRRLAFPLDFDARKSSVEATAREAYVCGVATKASHRGKGIAANLLRKCFATAQKSIVLEKVTLGTDRFNASAVRAYLRAGMLETKSVNSGRLMAKDVYLDTP